MTEKLFFYVANYSPNTERTTGGGIDEEEIDVLELPLAEAMRMIGTGEIQDGKTIMLLQYLWIEKHLKN